MTYIDTYENQILIHQTHSSHIDNQTAVRILELEDIGWEWENTVRIPEHNCCYVVLTKPNFVMAVEYEKARDYIKY